MALLPELAADCTRCAALCCVVPAFTRSAEFAEDKPPATPCKNLAADHRCSIHARLRSSGYAGCTVFECFGAGQRLTSLQENVPSAAVFFGLRRQHQTLWLLREALGYALSTLRREQVSAAIEAVVVEAERLDGVPDPSAVRLLRAVSADLRSTYAEVVLPDRLFGADLRGRDLRGADLRGAMLLGARLDGVDLTSADLTGADLRATRLQGADLTDALFVHASQLDAAAGDSTTRLPSGMRRPGHW